MELVVSTRSRTATNMAETYHEASENSRSNSLSSHAPDEDGSEVSLRCILNELHEFRKDNKTQLSGITQE